MDRELIEKVTRIVIATLEDMKENGSFSNQQAVKIWPHTSPLSEPVVLTYTDCGGFENRDKMVSISPYV